MKTWENDDERVCLGESHSRGAKPPFKGDLHFLTLTSRILWILR